MLLRLRVKYQIREDGSGNPGTATSPQCDNIIAVYGSFLSPAPSYKILSHVLGFPLWDSQLPVIARILAVKDAAIPPRTASNATQPVPMLDLKRQYEPLQQELLKAVGHVLETQQFILGEQVAVL